MHWKPFLDELDEQTEVTSLADDDESTDCSDVAELCVCMCNSVFEKVRLDFCWMKITWSLVVIMWITWSVVAWYIHLSALLCWMVITWSFVAWWIDITFLLDVNNIHSIDLWLRLHIWIVNLNNMMEINNKSSCSRVYRFNVKVQCLSIWHINNVSFLIFWGEEIYWKEIH